MPLLIRGARQVDKTSSVRHLGESFEHYVEIGWKLIKAQVPKFLSSRLSITNFYDKRTDSKYVFIGDPCQFNLRLTKIRKKRNIIHTKDEKRREKETKRSEKEEKNIFFARTNREIKKNIYLRSDNWQME